MSFFDKPNHDCPPESQHIPLPHLPTPPTQIAYPTRLSHSPETRRVLLSTPSHSFRSPSSSGESITLQPHQARRSTISTRRRDARSSTSDMKWKIYTVATACMMSVGSHYGSYLLGPLKSRLKEHLHTNNAQFSLLIASFSLNSTWTPLVTGLLISRIGVVKSAVFATGIICAGQAILYLGHSSESVHVMALGIFLFGLTISPLSVCQESLIFHLWTSPHSHAPASGREVAQGGQTGHGNTNLLLSLALLLGKFSSFMAALTTVPLADQYGDDAPFSLSFTFCAISFALTLCLYLGERWRRRRHLESQVDDVDLEDDEINEEAFELDPERMTEDEAENRAAADISADVIKLSMEERVKEKKKIKFKSLINLGDAFWWYIFVNVLSGIIWSPFIHLSSNILQIRYHLSEKKASAESSVILFMAPILYPMVGYACDKLKTRRPEISISLLCVSSCLVAFSYAWLVLPPSWTKSPLVGLMTYSIGHGMATLLLVIIVGTLVSKDYISTALGMHKALEMSGSTISQTIAGVLLDVKSLKQAPQPAEQPHMEIDRPSLVPLIDHVRLLIRTEGTEGREIPPTLPMSERKRAVTTVLLSFLLVALLQTASVFILRSFVCRKLRHQALLELERSPGGGDYHPVLQSGSELIEGDEEDDDDLHRFDDNSPLTEDESSILSSVPPPISPYPHPPTALVPYSVRLRGLFGLSLSIAVIAVAWITFWVSAFVERL